MDLAVSQIAGPLDPGILRPVLEYEETEVGGVVTANHTPGYLDFPNCMQEGYVQYNMSCKSRCLLLIVSSGAHMFQTQSQVNVFVEV